MENKVFLPDSDLEILRNALERIGKSVEMIGNASLSVYPSLMVEKGFEFSVRDFLKLLDTIYGVHSELTFTGSDRSVPPERGIILYRIIADVAIWMIEQIPMRKIRIDFSIENENLFMKMHSVFKSRLQEESVKGLKSKSASIIKIMEVAGGNCQLSDEPHSSFTFSINLPLNQS